MKRRIEPDHAHARVRQGVCILNRSAQKGRERAGRQESAGMTPRAAPSVSSFPSRQSMNMPRRLMVTARSIPLRVHGPEELFGAFVVQVPVGPSARNTY